MPKTFRFSFLFSSLSWIIFLFLGPEKRIFTYYGIRWEDCECMSFSSPLDKDIFAESSLTLVGFSH